MNARDIQFFKEHLKVGEAYEINKFRVIHNRTSSKIVPHAAILELNRKTVIVPINKTSQDIPMQWFDCIKFEQLHNKIDTDVELTGNLVLGSTGATVYMFNPDIPQLSEYKHRFEHLRSPVRILPTSANMHVGRPIGGSAESKTIDNLLLLDPALHRVSLSSPTY
ncbi:hypothetical protein DVH24_013941 [Malus domestica]|uniref:Uncharacterized protein n=1 Tax=Malus domestica TaxID=3750 RepID=A0A498JES0_MALDO|nr:hypothetical protein DVH24_013941 [Malus domestica]